MKKRKIILLYTLLFAVVFLTSTLVTIRLTGSAPQKLLRADFRGTVLRNLPYENAGGHCYDLYIPDGAPRQLILYIHGGSFNSGAKEDGDAWCRFYASRGYVTATLDYSLQNRGAVADLHLMNAEVGSCVRAIREECLARGIDLDGMAVCGVSAGGTLAMNYAYTCAGTSAVPVRFVFQLAAPADFEPSDWDVLLRVNKWANRKVFVEQMTGHTVTDAQMADGAYQPYIDAISPARLVRADTVPTLCGYGLRDHLIPRTSRERLLAALTKMGVPHDYLPFPNANHGMYADLDVMQRFIDMSLDYCERYFAAE